MAKLKAAVRNKLSASTFALPKQRKYPLNDASHARNALARSAGKPIAAQVKRKVKSMYPSMKISGLARAK